MRRASDLVHRLVHVAHGSEKFFGALCAAFGRSVEEFCVFLVLHGGLVHLFVVLADVFIDEVQEVEGAFRQSFHRAHDLPGEALDSLCRFLRLLGELADLAGDDGEAASLLAGARRLDARIQREEVRLLGDVRDGLRERLDLLHDLRSFDGIFHGGFRRAVDAV